MNEECNLREVKPIWLPSRPVCGTLVKTRLSGIQGMITCIQDRFDRYMYEISYFIAGKQEIIWMNQQEFEIITEEEPAVGFARKPVT